MSYHCKMKHCNDLLTRVANYNNFIYYRYTSLHLSCNEGHCEIVKALIDAGGEVDAVTIKG